MCSVSSHASGKSGQVEDLLFGSEKIMKEHGYLALVVVPFIGIVGIWIWLMSHGLPFNRFYTTIAVLVAAMIVGGMLNVLGAVFNWDGCFEHGGALEWLDRNFGRVSARIFCFVLGIALAYFGHYGAKILLIMGWIEKTQQ
jgi:uncharacterized membrane protein